MGNERVWYMIDYSATKKKKEDNMDGLQGHYAKRNKSDRERQMLYYLPDS